MFAKRVIPCLDVNRGRVVKGTNFLNLRDAGDPVAVACAYEEEGADELVFLDITASHEGREIMLDVVRRTAEVVFMPLTVGGGIRTIDDIRALLNAGADKVSINSAACRNPEFVHQAARRFGSQCIVVNIDPKRVTRETAARCGKCTSTAGGSAPDGKPSPGPARSNAWGPARSCSPRWMPTARRTATTWKSRGPSPRAVRVPVVASGGAGCPEHLADAILLGGAEAALAASIFHFGEYSIRQTKQVMRDRGIPVRL